MAAATGIWNHAMATGNSLASPMDSSTSGSNSSSSDSATISANDFLTLLVTEMQNQDPTADTDPNEYINQLVQVNSLEQLIDINQTLTTDSTATTSSSGSKSTTTNQAAGRGANPPGANAAAARQSGTASHHGRAAATAKSAIAGATQALHPAGTVNGNLSVPASKAAAQRVAEALGGRTRIG